jgi:pyruvate,water dikinase
VNYIRDLSTLSQQDVALVGGKTASLGEMIGALTQEGVRVPGGFAITAPAYHYFLQHNQMEEKINALIATVDYNNHETLAKIGAQIRALIEQGSWPQDLQQEIVTAYEQLSTRYSTENCSVAVRSSATAEDLPNASFAGQQETWLNVVGANELLDACKRCFSSLFTDRAIMYRMEQGFAEEKIALSICVQKMVRSDLASSGVIFTLDVETGFQQVVSIAAAYGLGEAVVQGMVNPDEFLVYKKEPYPIIQKRLGSKTIKFVFGRKKFTETVPVPEADQHQFTLSDEQIGELAQLAIIIEKHYGRPMDIEWAQDGLDGKLYIVQARPETVYGTRKQLKLVRYQLKDAQPPTLLTGQSIGQKIATGTARVIKDKKDLVQIAPGDILVTVMTDPDWVPFMKKSAGIVTDIGGRTCHAAIVSRELGIPAVIGTGNATKIIADGQTISLDTSHGSTGYVYDGKVEFTVTTIDVAEKLKLPCDLMVNLADPESAFAASFLPVAGVGLARLEFIINNSIGVHPMAIMDIEKVTDAQVRAAIRERAAAYPSLQDFFIDTLACGVGMLAAAFYPRPVIVRLSDFKSNEYRDLLGGSYFEPEEENPMLGWRGAARYTTPSYEKAFALECAALKKVCSAHGERVESMGFDNIRIMVPFVRTLAEAQQTVAALAAHGLVRGQHGLQLFMMVEIPSNVLLLEKFAQYFDGFSIGSNDLTQLTLGVDRDSGLLHSLFDERDEAVKLFLLMAIEKARAAKKYIGICGQAPSDYPELADMLIKAGISSISLSIDAVLPFIERESATSRSS